MADLQTYDIFDFSPMVDYIRSHGELRSYAKGEYFATINSIATEIGIVASGAFSFSKPDFRGDLQILSLSFSGEFVGAFISAKGRRSAFDITAMCKSEVYVVDHQTMIDYIENELPPETIAQLYYAISYGFMFRGASYRCDSPEMRYLELIERCPQIYDVMSKSAIAAYLGITREHFSRLRSKLKNF